MWIGGRRSSEPPAPQDPHQWLESVDSPEALKWVRRQKTRTLNAIGDPAETALFKERLDGLNSEHKIPHVKLIGKHLYNFLRDADHSRGLWRRTSMGQYRQLNPDWETVLDLDALASQENEPWVWKSCVFLEAVPGVTPDVCLLRLSRGGSGEAVVVREFNLACKRFVLPPKGFVLPEAETFVTYEDRDTVLVATDTGPGSLTRSGLPRTVRRWARATPLAQSNLVFEGAPEDLFVHAWREHAGRGFVYDWHVRWTCYGIRERFVRIAKPLAHAHTTFQWLPVPPDIEAHLFADQLIMVLKDNCTPAAGVSFLAGSVVATSLPELLAGNGATWTILFQPTLNSTCINISRTRDFVVLQVLDAVKSQIVPIRYTRAGTWMRFAAEPVAITRLEISPVDFHRLNQIWITSQSFLQPLALWIAEVSDKPLAPQKLKFAPATFDAAGMEESQQWAHSRDGTAIPYFLVKNTGTSGSRPTVLHGYGGFGGCLLPGYLGTMGSAWLSKGGALAYANIRGGGEFGRRWHQAAVRTGRHLSFEDFAAVAQDLDRTGVSTPKMLAARGRSNGGLLVGNMLVKYPQLFGAIVSEVPLLDMHRYHQLLDGASWLGEYGDPRHAAESRFWDHNCPYCNIERSVDYPPVLFLTSTGDKHVHPAHARKMAAKMQAMVPGSAGHTFFYESKDGEGHRLVGRKRVARLDSMVFEFLDKALGLSVAHY